MIRYLVALSLFLSSCAYFRSATTPMPMARYAAPADSADTLVVLLPGMGDSPEDFVDQGFVRRIQEVRPTADVIAADAHFGYYRSRTFLQRLKSDVIDPVAARYEQIWLVGISLGGFGSAIFCEQNPETIDGMILLAPFMGERDIVEQVRAAGGLAKWTPPADIAGMADDAEQKFTQLWAFYRGYANETAATMPKLYLGWGESDGLHVPNGMVADVLPSEQSLAMPGGHKWTVWRPLFDQLVVRALAND